MSSYYHPHEDSELGPGQVYFIFTILDPKSEGNDIN